MRRRLSPGDRRKEILEVATRAFAEKPFDEVHVDAIAREANASRALVNHYFRDKRGLFLAVAQDALDRLPSFVRDDLDLPTEEMVAANTARWLDLVEAGRRTFLLFATGGPLGHDPKLDELLDRFCDGVSYRILVNHLGTTTEIPAAARFTMRAAIGMIERAMIDWVTGRGLTREQTQALITQTILTTVREIIPAVEAADDSGTTDG